MARLCFPAAFRELRAAVLLASTAAFLCSCSTSATLDVTRRQAAPVSTLPDTNVTMPGTVTPDQSRVTDQAAQPVVGRPVTLEWESVAEIPGEVTGIKSSHDLVTWTEETRFEILNVTNRWTDSNVIPPKFWRAFNAPP